MENNQFLVHISSKRKKLNFNLNETWQYRDLVLLLVRRDFVSKYKQTILGPLWAVIQPLFTTVVFTIVFGNLANLTIFDVEVTEPVIVPGFLFYMAGTICWSYFSSTLTTISNTFIGNSGIMGKVYFPRLSVPIASSFSGLISFFIQFIMFVIIWLVYIVRGTTTMHLTIYALLLPLLIVQMMMLTVGAGIIVSSLTTKYRDLVMAIGFVIQLLQYASPVAYGLVLVPDRFITIYTLNPITQIIVVFRYAFFGIGYFDLTTYLGSWVITVIIFIVGTLMFNYVEKTFMDTV